MSTISIRISDDLERQLSAEADTQGRPRSELVRQAIQEFVSRKEKERFMAELLAEASEAYSNPEMRREIKDLEKDFDLLESIYESHESARPGRNNESERWWK